MKEYKRRLKIARLLYFIEALILLALYVIGLLAQCDVIRIPHMIGEDLWKGTWGTIISCLPLGSLAINLVNLIQISKALRNEKILKKLYVAANDERQQKINTSSATLSMQISSTLELVAGIVIGYFHMTISIVLLSCVALHTLILTLCGLYYGKKY